MIEMCLCRSAKGEHKQTIEIRLLIAACEWGAKVILHSIVTWFLNWLELVCVCDMNAMLIIQWYLSHWVLFKIISATWSLMDFNRFFIPRLRCKCDNFLCRFVFIDAEAEGRMLNDILLVRNANAIKELLYKVDALKTIVPTLKNTLDFFETVQDNHSVLALLVILKWGNGENLLFIFMAKCFPSNYKGKYMKQ